MDEARLKALWEYADIGDSVTAEQLVKVLTLYAGSAAESQAELLQAAAKEVIAKEGSDAQKVLSAVLDPGSAVAKVIADKTPAASEGSATEAGSKLRTILDDNFEDDDDEDSSVGEENAAKQGGKRKGMTILMRGFLKAKEGKLEWTGNWAMSTEAFDAGDKAKFRYEMRGDAAKYEKDGKIISMPSTATFDGSFLVKAPEVPNGFNRIDEKGIRMEFATAPSSAHWKITGSGVNQIAEFMLEGELDGASRRMAVYKTYLHNDDGSSDGSDSEEIEGEEGELDPDELADLRADQRQTFGHVLAGEEQTASKPKKRRMVEG